MLEAILKSRPMKDKHVKYLGWISLGLVVVIILYLITINFIFSSWSIRGTFGDSFGALNTLFSGLAFAGVIITILIQKEEIKAQRHEFLLDRTTTLVYYQLERFENAVSKLKISNDGEDYLGDSAIGILDKHRSSNIYVFEANNTDDIEKEKKKQINRKHSEVHILNKLEIEKFAQNVYNSVEVLKNLIYTSSLDVHELNEIKKLFFDNVGFVVMDVIEHISDTDTEQLDLFIDDDYVRFSMDVGVLKRANKFLKPVKEFYHVQFTKDNLDVLKKDWRVKSGRI